jgi:hypothetical protein
LASGTLSADGSIDNSAKTGIPDATQFANQSGTSTPDPGIFLFGHPGNYTTTVHGRFSWSGTATELS